MKIYHKLRIDFKITLFGFKNYRKSNTNLIQKRNSETEKFVQKKNDFV